MKVIIVNKEFTSGGAAIAARRLFNALLKSGRRIQPQLLVQQKIKKANNDEASTGIISITKNFVSGKLNFIRFVFERILFLFYERDKQVRFAFSIGNTGQDISLNKHIRKAEIIHLHWFNQGFISLKGLNSLLKSGKPVVWTLHDMWAFTGGCHYSGVCKNYENTCGNCPFLRCPSKNDLSFKIFKRKEKLYGSFDFTVVTCSGWLAEKAGQSKLLQNIKIVNIPNPIDTGLFKPGNRAESRARYKLPDDKFLVLLLSANLLDKRKGFALFREAILYLYKESPEITENIEIILTGKKGEEAARQLPVKCHNLGIVNSENEIVDIYNCANVFVLPTQEDNLPNTVMEALSCGIPCVSFNVGGLPELIDHLKCGYLAQEKDSVDLGKGLKWIYDHNDKKALSDNARNKAKNNFSEQVVADKYYKLYENILSK